MLVVSNLHVGAFRCVSRDMSASSTRAASAYLFRVVLSAVGSDTAQTL